LKVKLTSIVQRRYKQAKNFGFCTCCDRKALVAIVQSFTLATSNNRDHIPRSLYYTYLRQVYLKNTSQLHVTYLNRCTVFQIWRYLHWLSSAGVPKLTLAMYPFSVLIDKHVPLKFLMT